MLKLLNSEKIIAEGFKKVYSFQKHIDEWKEDYSCQIRILDNSKTSKIDR